jgi:hypothetical protein
MESLPSDQSYSFSVIFAADASVQEIARRRFLDYVKSLEGLVREAPSRETYQINFDLLPWTANRRP